MLGSEFLESEISYNSLWLRNNLEIIICTYYFKILVREEGIT